MKKVCLTNDDGPHSQGMLELAKSLAEFTDLSVVVPEGQRSATGKSLTLNRPLRVTDRGNARGYRLITHDGTPADSVVLADFFVKGVDLYVSGINAGGNIGYQSMLTSGTVGAAFEAILKGFPAIAISQETVPNDWFDTDGSEGNFDLVCKISADIIRKTLDKGLPFEIDGINVNFPLCVTEETEIEYTIPARVRLANRVDHRIDPHGRDYYWFEGIEMDGQPGDDVKAVMANHNISISPIIVESVRESDIERLRAFIDL